MSGIGNKFSSYSLTQLNELLEDDEKLNSIVQEMEEVLEVQRSKEMTLAENRTLAEQNLELQPRLDCQKNELTKRYRCLQELFEAYQVRKSTLDQCSGSNSLDTLLALLQAEGAKIEEETENMADSFLEGEMSLDAFVEGYQSSRKLAHLRRVKIDKLQEMVVAGQRVPQSPAQPAPSPGGAPAAPLSFFAGANGSPCPSPAGRPSPARPAPRRSPPGRPGLPYPVTPYPRSARAGQTAGYPTPSVPYFPQYPQRPPRLAPSPASSCSDGLRSCRPRACLRMMGGGCWGCSGWGGHRARRPRKRRGQHVVLISPNTTRLQQQRLQQNCPSAEGLLPTPFR
ncbi:hypothetical protein ANANG_G00187320 [Anguilla anguilla]|uniref:VPS37 C-terminal domain-containing protein n=1 Tax=Anguilla anguilla TaxID=7936 RepID=A0A9D3RRJ0_ANGAN|nr:hypothetical protein ANANG_G00187320 [Anguilla anguilla]